VSVDEPLWNTKPPVSDDVDKLPPIDAGDAAARRAIIATPRLDVVCSSD
jgi:hypothetical protein